MGVGKPQQAQEPDEDNLAEDRIAVDQEGNEAAHNGSLDQVKNSHTRLCLVQRQQTAALRPPPRQGCRLAERYDDYKINEGKSCAKDKLIPDRLQRPLDEGPVEVGENLLN